jgi:hypothetical protein
VANGGIIDTGGGDITNTGGGDIDLGTGGGIGGTGSTGTTTTGGTPGALAKWDTSSKLKDAVADVDYVAPGSLGETIDDRVAGLLVAGTGIGLSYNDPGNALTISATLTLSSLGAAPSDATYIVQTASSGLSAEQALGSLATGLVKNTTTTGVLSIAVAGTDYAAASHSHTASDISNFSEAVDDRVAALLVAGTGIGLSYNDPGNALTISAMPQLPGGGGGTPGQLIKWTGSHELADSGIYADSAGRLDLQTHSFGLGGDMWIEAGISNRLAKYSNAGTLFYSTIVASGSGIITLQSFATTTMQFSGGDPYSVMGFDGANWGPMPLPDVGGLLGAGNGESGRLAVWYPDGSTLDNSHIAVSTGGTLELYDHALTLGGDFGTEGGGDLTFTSDADVNVQLNGADPYNVLAFDGANWGPMLLSDLGVVFGAGSGEAGKLAIWYPDDSTLGNSHIAATNGGTLSLYDHALTLGGDLTLAGGGDLTLNADDSYTVYARASGTLVLGVGAATLVPFFTDANTVATDANFLYESGSHRLNLGALNVGTATGATAGQLRASGRIITSEYIETNDGNAWDLGLWEATPITPTGRISISIDGVKYWLAATPA